MINAKFLVDTYVRMTKKMGAVEFCVFIIFHVLPALIIFCKKYMGINEEVFKI